MILPTNQNDFDKLAHEVTSSFFTDGATLNDGIIKVAQRENLNPEEVRRLVERTNVSTTVQMLKISTDKNIEFKLAEYDSVINATHPSGTSQPVVETSGCSEIPSALPNMFAFDGPGFAISTDKVASENPVNLAREIFLCKKAMEEDKQGIIVAESRILNNIDRLVSEFETYNGPSFSKFANEAYTLDGDFSKPIINAIAGMLRTKVVVEKTAGIIDDTTELLSKYASIRNDLATIVSLRSSLSENEAKYKSLSESAGVNFSNGK